MRFLLVFTSAAIIQSSTKKPAYGIQYTGSKKDIGGCFVTIHHQEYKPASH